MSKRPWPSTFLLSQAVQVRDVRAAVESCSSACGRKSPQSEADCSSLSLLSGLGIVGRRNGDEFHDGRTADAQVGSNQSLNDVLPESPGNS